MPCAEPAPRCHWPILPSLSCSRADWAEQGQAPPRSRRQNAPGAATAPLPRCLCGPAEAAASSEMALVQSPGHTAATSVPPTRTGASQRCSGTGSCRGPGGKETAGSRSRSALSPAATRAGHGTTNPPEPPAAPSARSEPRAPAQPSAAPTCAGAASELRRCFTGASQSLPFRILGIPSMFQITPSRIPVAPNVVPVASNHPQYGSFHSQSLSVRVQCGPSHTFHEAICPCCGPSCSQYKSSHLQ